MRLMIYFFTEHWWPNSLGVAIYGRYSTVGFAFSEEKKLTIYGIRQGGCFSEFHNGADMLCNEEGKLDLLLPDVDAQTVDVIHRTCEALVKAKVPFNLQDFLLAPLGFQVPDRPLFDCKTLHYAQAVILVLRECLPKDHELLGALAAFNSRQAYPETLYDRIALYCIPVFNSKDFELPVAPREKRLGRSD
jgi:hypothetical protein